MHEEIAESKTAREAYEITEYGYFLKLTPAVLIGMGLASVMRDYRATDISSENREVIMPWSDQWSVNGMKKPQKGLFLYGNYEQAKIITAVCLMSIRRRCFNVKALSSFDLIPTSQGEDYEKFKGASLLGIFNLGGEPRNKPGYSDDILSTIVNHRYERRLPTIIASRFTADEFHEVYPTSVIEAIAFSSNVVECK